MKDIYVAPVIEIIEFEEEDVITTSVTGYPDTSGENELPFVPYNP